MNTVKLSATSKLSGVKSWSLQAGDTCPGSRDENGQIVPVCIGCYAKGGNYRFNNVRAAREHNKQDWKREQWVNDMVTLLHKADYFRWFDSGDVYCVGLALKILQVVQKTPNTKHWLPTRSYKFPKIKKVLDKIKALPNAMVRYSSDAIDGNYDLIHGSTVLPRSDTPTKAFVCRAYNNDGKCGKCRACYDKHVLVIAYVAHGQKMKRMVLNT